MKPDFEGRGSARNSNEKKGKRLHLLVLSEALVVEALPVLEKIRRTQRYRYGQKLDDGFFGLPDKVIEAANARTKTKVGALYDHVEKLNSTLRVAAEDGMISSRFVGEIMQGPRDDGSNGKGGLLYQIGSMTAAWRSRVMDK
jgi:hypothetical protein